MVISWLPRVCRDPLLSPWHAMTSHTFLPAAMISALSMSQFQKNLQQNSHTHWCRFTAVDTENPH